MAKTIAIANHKGGVGKTTTALCLADAMRNDGKRVLFVDMDPQCNSTGTYDAKTEEEYTLYDLLMDKDCKIHDVIQKTETGDIVPGDRLLAEQETNSRLEAKMNKYVLLKNALKDVDAEYDYVIIDTPPNIGLFMLMSMVAADGVIVPIKAEKYSIDGLDSFIKVLNQVVYEANPELKLYGVLLTHYDMRNDLDRQIWNILGSVGTEKGFNVFSTPIRICQSVKNAQNNKMPLTMFNGKCNAAIDYDAVAKELKGVM